MSSFTTDTKSISQASLTIWPDEGFRARLYDSKRSPLYGMQFFVSDISVFETSQCLFCDGQVVTDDDKNAIRDALKKTCVNGYRIYEDQTRVSVNCRWNTALDGEVRVCGTVVPNQRWIPRNNLWSECLLSSYPLVIGTLRAHETRLTITDEQEDGTGLAHLWAGQSFICFAAKGIKVTFRGGSPPFLCPRPMEKAANAQYLLKLLEPMEVCEYSVYGLHVAVTCRDKRTSSRCYVHGEIIFDRCRSVRRGSVVWTANGAMV